ncbi:MAG: hypothetical protein WDM80_12105 [Limisphaerales bacterium]
MQKTEHAGRLLHLSGTGKGFCVIICLLVLAVSSVRAQEAIMTLAMNQPVKKESSVFTAYSLYDINSSPSNVKNDQPQIVTLNDEKTAALKSDILLENQTNSIVRESFLIIQDSRSHSNRIVTVQAGYGQLWNDNSMLQKIVCGHQEPGCAYVSANFSF